MSILRASTKILIPHKQISPNDSASGSAARSKITEIKESKCSLCTSDHEEALQFFIPYDGSKECLKVDDDLCQPWNEIRVKVPEIEKFH